MQGIILLFQCLSFQKLQESWDYFLNAKLNFSFWVLSELRSIIHNVPIISGWLNPCLFSTFRLFLYTVLNLCYCCYWRTFYASCLVSFSSFHLSLIKVLLSEYENIWTVWWYYKKICDHFQISSFFAAFKHFQPWVKCLNQTKTIVNGSVIFEIMIYSRGKNSEGYEHRRPVKVKPQHRCELW